LIAFVGAAVIALTPVQTSRIDSIVQTVMSDRHIAGLSLGVARMGTPLYLRGYGVRNARGDPADGYTIYATGSIVKQFTAALVLQQVALGRLALDGHENPTIRQLLDQTAGGKWEYRNENYAMLGDVLQRSTGQPFCTLLARQVLEPLQLSSTGCSVPRNAFNVATGAISPYESLAPAAGGLWSNAVDLVAWLDALRAGRVVSPELFGTMTRSGSVDGIPTNYGFGFFIGNWYGYRTIFHSGNVDGFSCEDALVLDDGLEIAALSNADRIDLVPLVKSVVAILDPPRDTNLYATPGAKPQNENPKIAEQLADLLRAKAFAPLGKLQTLEFVERTFAAGVTYDEYRATFERGQRWITVGYDENATIESLDISVGDR
jgi:CubicO group peptidase (beta-lactamase class C family)